MNVLIVGCGDIGNLLGELFLKEGTTVWGIRRNIRKLSPGITPIEIDLSQPINRELLPSEVHYVFYLAAADESSDEAYKRVYVDGVKNILQALRKQETFRRFFFISSTSVYHQTDGEWVDEDSPVKPTHFTGVRMLEGETIVKNSGLSFTTVRFGGIYGSGRERLLDRIKKGEEKLTLGRAPLYTNRIHRTDCAQILKHLTTISSPHPLYLGVDNEPAEKNSVISYLSAVLGITPQIGESKTLSPIQRQSNKRCSNKRLLATNFSFIYPTFREGYEELLAAK